MSIVSLDVQIRQILNSATHSTYDAKELARMLHVNPDSVKGTLSRAARRGSIVRVKRGQYKGIR